MIDTIALTFESEVGEDELSHWDRTIAEKSDGRFNIVYRLNVVLKNNATVQCTYYPRNYQGTPQLIIEFSLPKLVLRNNYTMLFDIEGAIQCANETISMIQGLPSLDLRHGVLYRLDICYNHQVGDLVPYYIGALQHLKYPRRKTAPYSDEGVQFRNKQQSTKFYDKEKECGSSEAHGILRQERTIRSRGLKRLLKDVKPTVGLLTGRFLLDVLEKDLQYLGVLDRSIATRDTALETLTKSHGLLSGIFHYGLLRARISYPTLDALADATKYHPRSINRRLKSIVEAGVPLTLAEYEEPLPPLVIDREMVLGKIKVAGSNDRGEPDGGGSDDR